MIQKIAFWAAYMAFLFLIATLSMCASIALGAHGHAQTTSGIGEAE